MKRVYKFTIDSKIQNINLLDIIENKLGEWNILFDSNKLSQVCKFFYEGTGSTDGKSFYYKYKLEEK